MTGELPQDSAGHKGKHESTVHLLITPEQIEYRADCPNHAVYRETRVFLDWLEDELTFAAINWLNFIPKELGGTAPKLTKKELLLNGKPDIDNTSDLRFGISQEKAFEIIEDSGIYSDKMVFLRELIQNAEDASKIQLWQDLQKRPGLYLNDSANKDDLSHIQPYDIKPEAFDCYKITVDLRQVADGKVQIQIIDCGTGISVETVKQMCKVGTSYHQDKARRRQIEAMPAWLRPTAGFGTGLQSVFLVAPSFTIYSRTQEKAIKVTVESRKKEGYVQVETDNTKKDQGTCVAVTITEDQIPSASRYSYDYFSTLKRESTLYDELYTMLRSYGMASFFTIIIKRENVIWKAIEREPWQMLQTGSQENGQFKFVQQPGGGMVVWDSKTYTLFYLGCGNDGRAWRAAFKGKSLDNENILSQIVPGLHLSADFYGLDAKTFLAINRKVIKHDKLIDVQNIVNTMIKASVEFLLYQNDICEWMQAKEEKNPFYPMDCYFILWQIADSEQKQYMLSEPGRFLQPMTGKVKVLKWGTDERYEESDVSIETILKDFQDYAFFSYYDSIAFPPRWELSSERTRNKIIEFCSDISEKINHVNIILECAHALRIPGAKLQWLWCSQDSFSVYGFGDSSIPCYEISNEAQCNIFKLLFYGSKYYFRNHVPERYCIPAAREYSPLAIQSDKSHTRPLLQTIPASYCVIFPCLSNDDRVKQYSKPEFIAWVIQSHEFNNLVDYVLENRIDPAPCTKGDIIRAYKRLLSEYYDAKNESDAPTDKSESK